MKTHSRGTPRTIAISHRNSNIREHAIYLFQGRTRKNTSTLNWKRNIVWATRGSVAPGMDRGGPRGAVRCWRWQNQTRTKALSGLLRECHGQLWLRVWPESRGKHHMQSFWKLRQGKSQIQTIPELTNSNNSTTCIHAHEGRIVWAPRGSVAPGLRRARIRLSEAISNLVAGVPWYVDGTVGFHSEGATRDSARDRLWTVNAYLFQGHTNRNSYCDSLISNTKSTNSNN